MRSLLDHLSQYAAYHRDRRNIATHLVGIPMIVLSITTLLARASATVGPLGVSLAMLVAALAALFYLKLDARLGVAMAAALLALVAAGQWLGGQGRIVWLGAGIGLFVLGWVIQFVGHAFEGRKPAFVDDLSGLLIGPLFVAAEIGFACGLRRPLQAAIEARVGPTRVAAGRGPARGAGA